MNIAYWLAITSTGTFTWIIFAHTILPLLLITIAIIHPAIIEWCALFFIKIIIDLCRFIYRYLFISIVIIFFLSLFIIGVIYLIYFVAKYIFLKVPITAPAGKAILEFIVMKEFTDLGFFNLVDYVLSYFFPPLYGGPPIGTFKSAILNFSTSFIQKIKEGDEPEAEPEPEPTGVTKNPNLTDDDNDDVNYKFEKCLNDNMPGDYNGDNQFQLLKYQYMSSVAKTKCELLKIADIFNIKSTK